MEFDIIITPLEIGAIQLKGVLMQKKHKRPMFELYLKFKLFGFKVKVKFRQ